VLFNEPKMIIVRCS